MKTVILAGGYGTRLAEYTDKVPKPMVQIGNKPILSHIMNFYQSYGYDEFIIAAGYKKDVIREYYEGSKEFKNIKIKSEYLLRKLSLVRVFKKLKSSIFVKKDHFEMI